MVDLFGCTAGHEVDDRRIVELTADGKCVVRMQIGRIALCQSRGNSTLRSGTGAAFPEGTLWRSKVDGSQRLQLTFPPLRASHPKWSPDGKQIAFMAQAPGKPWKIHLISAEGGTAQELMPGQRNETDPDWSPDGNSLVFGLFAGLGTEALAIHVLDLRTHQVSTLPGSEGLWTPQWSPDGSYIAALTADFWKLVLFDFTTRKWAELTEVPTVHQIWSRDGKHLYFRSGREDRAVFRVRISDRKLERVLGLKGFQDAMGPGPGGGFTLTPDDSPLLLRDAGIQDIYALDWEAP